jgi:hypothetical protein
VTFPWSDLAGTVSGVLLVVPALKDQLYRWRAAEQTRRAVGSPWPGLRLAARDAWNEHRDAYDGIDSAFTAIGAAMIVVAFGLKLFGA